MMCIDKYTRKGEIMDVSVEVISIDTRYENCRWKNGPSEKRMLISIMEAGIRDPLLGVVKNNCYILLDGFKRYRCAKKANIGYVMFRPIGEDEAEAILSLLRLANASSLCFLEQARLIDELRTVHKLSVAEIARRLERSSAWVSVRQGMIAELTPLITEKLMNGNFPMHAYLASVRPITRVNKTQPEEIEEFIRATSNKSLSVREIDILAKGYFKGGNDFREHVHQGDIKWCINALRHTDAVSPSSKNSVEEGKVLIDLDIILKRIRRLSPILSSDNLRSPSFLAEAHLLTGGILRFLDNFSNVTRGFHDRTRPQKSHSSPPQQENGHSYYLT
jgi:hypothetical protein